MRRIISLVLVYCLLHTSTYAAAADLASLKTDHPEAATVSMPAEKAPEILDIPHRHRAHHVPAYITTLAVLALVVPLCAGFGTWWSLQPPSVAKTNVCFPHQTPDDTSYFQQLQHHYSNGDMPLTAGIQDWLNANTAVMTGLSETAHDLRHDDHEEAGESWSKTQSMIYNVLHNHGVEKLGGRSIACDINLGDGTTPDRISECERRKPPRPTESETFKDGVGARLWLHPDRKQRLLARNIGFVARSLMESQLYPNPAQSLNIESKEAKYDSRRTLLQTGNTLSLPQAIQTTLNARNDVRQLLATISGNMRQWDPSTAKITALNALIKGIFEAHGFVMTGNVHCGLVLGNGEVMLSDCALASARRAAQTALEKITFKQSYKNPVKVDGVDIETNVLPAQDALPLVLQRAANPLHGELDILRQDRCSAEDQSRITAVQDAVLDALAIPNVALPTDMACDVTVHKGALYRIVCHPDVAPQTAVCGHYNGTFAAHGRVWVTPNGDFVVSANRNWNRTATVELPVTPTFERTQSLTLKHTRSVTLPQTVSETLPVVDRPAAQNTTTRIYWADDTTSKIWVADINATDGKKLASRTFTSTTILGGVPYSMWIDWVNNYFYFGLFAQGIYAALITSFTPFKIGNKTLLVDIGYPYSFSVDAINGKLYWLDNSYNIRFGNLNLIAPKSINSSTILIKNVGCTPYSLFIDVYNMRIYTASYGSGATAARGIYAGEMNTTLSSITNVRYLGDPFYYDPNKIAIDFNQGKLYARTDHDQGTIYVARINTSYPQKMTSFEYSFPANGLSTTNAIFFGG